MGSASSTSFTISPISQSRSDTPAAIAGVAHRRGAGLAVPLGAARGLQGCWGVRPQMTHVTHAQAFDTLADPSQGLFYRNFCKKYFWEIDFENIMPRQRVADLNIHSWTARSPFRFRFGQIGKFGPGKARRPLSPKERGPTQGQDGPDGAGEATGPGRGTTTPAARGSGIAWHSPGAGRAF